MLDSYSKFYSALIALLIVSACSTAQSVQEKEQSRIENPFGNYNQETNDPSRNITFRSKKGDQALELEFPEKGNSDMVIPMNSKYQNNERTSIAGTDEVDYQYKDRKPSMADREIASTFGGSKNLEDESKRHEIEQNLGLQPSDEAPNMDESYLAKLDVVKQLFRTKRYEAAMIEIDQLVKSYPTNSRLYEMRGTLLDRMGYQDLALRSWKQAIELDPTRVTLKKTIEKREQQRSVASERK